MDGTLLTDEKIINEKTAQTLLKAQQQGHHVMFATGRAYRATSQYYNQLGLATPIVNFNGAFVHHPSNQLWKTIHETLPLDIVKELLGSMQGFKWDNIIAEVSDDVYMQKADDKLIQAFSRQGNPRIRTGEMNQLLRANPTNLLINTSLENAGMIQDYLTDMHGDKVGHRLWASPWGNVIEVFRSGLSKGSGLAHVAKWMDIPRERIIAFGDENNDLEMIEYAGVGIAMENSIDALKLIADEIAPTSNNEDGIAHVLEERLGLK